MKKFFLGLLKTATLGMIAAIMLGWLQNLHPIFDALSTFRLHLILLLAVSILMLIFVRAWGWLISGLVVSAISLYLSAPYLPGFQPARSASNFSVVQFNMLYYNLNLNNALQSLHSVNPDVYILQELTNYNLVVFKELKKTHPYQLECISTVVGSIAIASRHPFDEEFEAVCNRSAGLGIVRIKKDRRTITLASLHLKWPWPFQQHQQITRIEKQLKDLSGPLILAGDFNAAPWTNAVGRVARLTNAKPAPGLIFSWTPRFREFETNLMPMLPIDQILLRGGKLMDRKLLDEAGSDHFPILSEIQF